MTLNEEEIPSVSDKSPISAKQHKINRKRSVRDILIDLPPISSKYTPIRVENRPFVPLVENDSRNPLGLFRLFITRQHCRIIANHTNIKANNYMEKEKENNHRVWTDTTDSEIEVFLGILILMGLDHLPTTEDYWNQRPDKPVIMPILSAMSLGRFCHGSTRHYFGRLERNKPQAEVTGSRVRARLIAAFTVSIAGQCSNLLDPSTSRSRARGRWTI